MPDYIEKEGEILPSYTGVNQPDYHGVDTVFPHDDDFNESHLAIAQSTAVPPVSPARSPRPLYEMPANSRGRSNNEPLPTPTQAQSGLSDAEIDRQQAINKPGIAAGRAILRQQTSLEMLK